MIRLLRLLLVFVCLGFANLGLAQKSNFRQSLWIGTKLGGQATRFLFVPSVRQHTHLSFQEAISIRYEVENFAALQLEVNHTTMGWRSRFDESDKHYQRNLSYIEMPLMAHIRWGKSPLQMFVNAGPIIGYNIGDSAVQSDNLGTLLYDTPITNKFYWGVGGGPGLSLALGKRHRIELEGRFVYSYGNIFPSTRTDAYAQSTSMRFAFSLNYFFRFANL